MSLGRVLSRASATMRAAPLRMAEIALLLSAAPGMLIEHALIVVSPYDAGFEVFDWTLAVALPLGMAMTVLTGGALVLAGAGRIGRTPRRRRAGLRAWPPLLLLGLAIGGAVTLGFLPLLALGVILYVRWCVAAPALAAEGLGVRSALARSAALTTGAGWPIFALLAVMTAVWVGFSLALELAGAAMLGGDDALYAARAEGALPPAFTAAGLLVQTATAAIWAAVQIALYAELRDRRDGPDTEELADIFT